MYLIGIMHVMHVPHTWSVHSLTRMQPLTQIRDVHGIFVTGLAFVILPPVADKPVSPGGGEDGWQALLPLEVYLYMEWIHALTAHVHWTCNVPMHSFLLRTCINTYTVVPLGAWYLRAKIGVGCLHGEAMSMYNAYVHMNQLLTRDDKIHTWIYPVRKLYIKPIDYCIHWKFCRDFISWNHEKAGSSNSLFEFCDYIGVPHSQTSYQKL